MTHPYIGMLGGLGYQSTIYAYRRLNELYQEKLGGDHSCPIKILSIDFCDINELLPYKMDMAAEKLLPHLQDLELLDSSVYLMINNTLHEAFDKTNFQFKKDTSFGHVGLLLSRFFANKTDSRVVILGTKYTMQNNYLSSFFAEGIKLEKLPEPLQEKVESLRLTYFDGKDPALAHQCFKEIEALQYDYIVIACTELSLAFEKIKKGNWVDTIDLQCRFAISHLLENKIR